MAATTAIHVALDCVDLDAQAEFWAAALGYEPYGNAPPYRSLVPAPGLIGPKLALQHTGEPKPPGKIRLHLDLVVGNAMASEAARLVAIGATQQSDLITEVGTSWIVMADPEGNEFCLVEN